MANFIDDYMGSLRDPNKGLEGIYRARVESNQDPLQIGRVQIRVPMLHGFPGSGIPNSSLPWAYPSTMSAGYGYGTFIVPEVGEYVFVIFEDSDKSKPVYIGSSFGSGASSPKLYGSADGTGVWSSDVGVNEVPVSARRVEPTRKIIYKSPKGASVEIDEENGNEQIAITDALGQMLKFESHLTKGAVHKRYDGDMDDLGDVSEYTSGARIVLKGVGKQNVEMCSGNGESTLNITCGAFAIKISSGSGGAVAHLVHDNGTSIDITNSGLSISGISSVDLKSPTINLRGGSINLIGDVTIIGS